MDIGRIGIWAMLEAMTARETLDFAKRIERPGQTQRQIPVLIAALHPKMLALAAAQADGTHPYFVPPDHTAKVQAQIGPGPWICVEQAVILEADATKAGAAACQHMSFYVTRLPNYKNNLKALGWQDADFDDGCSDRLVDAIVAWGTEDKICDRIQAHFRRCHASVYSGASGRQPAASRSARESRHSLPRR